MEAETFKTDAERRVQESNDKGELIAYMLNLKKDKQGRYDTTWGPKTATGLYYCMVTIVETPIESIKTA